MLRSNGVTHPACLLFLLQASGPLRRICQFVSVKELPGFMKY
uniref:Uncharacterized protein n=1 Tax=Anguilla anguilla TaxID=7936 RepID=A0A0E9SCP8_ANGAN